MAQLISIVDQLIGRTEAFTIGLAVGGMWVIFAVLFGQWEKKPK